MPAVLNNNKALQTLQRIVSNSTHPLNPSGLSSRKLVRLIEVVLVVLLAQQLAKLTWQLVPETPSAQSDWKQQAVAAQPQNQQQQSYARLNSLHLFGKPPAPGQTVAQTVNPDTVPRSRLSARLTGIVASSDPERSLAIINFRSKDNTYRIGDTLQGANAEVVDIYPDRVIVKNNGQHEALLLYPNNPNQRTAARQKPSAKSATPARELKELNSKLRKNPTSIAELISISPVRREGKLAGYRVNPKSRPDLFKAAGLQENDIALSINGVDLTDHMEAMKLLQELPQLQQISLTVERQGQIYQIDVSS